MEGSVYTDNEVKSSCEKVSHMFYTLCQFGLGSHRISNQRDTAPLRLDLDQLNLFVALKYLYRFSRVGFAVVYAI
jgi:hypothetical protein